MFSVGGLRIVVREDLSKKLRAKVLHVKRPFILEDVRRKNFIYVFQLVLT